MARKLSEELDRELARWRERLERLRVKAKLGQMELRDRERQVLEDFEPAYERAMERLAELRATAEEHARAARAGVGAGWKELRKTYREVRKQQGKASP